MVKVISGRGSVMLAGTEDFEGLVVVDEIVAEIVVEKFVAEVAVAEELVATDMLATKASNRKKRVNMTAS